MRPWRAWWRRVHLSVDTDRLKCPTLPILHALFGHNRLEIHAASSFLAMFGGLLDCDIDVNIGTLLLGTIDGV